MSRRLMRLRKLCEINQAENLAKNSQRCLVCMESITISNSAVIDCGHSQFCFDCISNWSTITNKCPLCAIRFYSITNSQTGEILTVQEKDQSEKQIFEDFYRAIRCQVCASPENEETMLLCDTCDKGFHTNCIGLIHIPNLEEWFCELCLRRKSIIKRVRQIKEMERCEKKEEQETQEQDEESEDEKIEKKRKLRSCREVRIKNVQLRRSKRIRKQINE